MHAAPWHEARDDSVAPPAIELSVVCPFFDEQGVVGDAVATLRSHLESRGMRFEIVLVDDGSTDDGRTEALVAAGGDPRVRVVGGERNRGRGHALRTGIEAARGALICTMEIDFAYGLDAIDRMVAILRRDRDADMVLVSPELPGGGYEGVPLVRVLATRWGNRLLRWTMSSGLTTHTGMTRCYRRRAIRGLPLHEDGKEFHLEVLSKALALGLVVVETPGRLRWPPSRRARAKIGRQVAITRRRASCSTLAAPRSSSGRPSRRRTCSAASPRSRARTWPSRSRRGRVCSA
jgi:glycosyltransferase involved in cell wall biosynthesis